MANISKQRRDDLIKKIGEIRKYISSAPQDENTGNLLTYLSELENDRPKSIYIKLDFSVGGNPETLKAGFDLSW